MTTYTFVANASEPWVNWSNGADWSGGVVPDDANADVVIPEITYLSTGLPYISNITVSNAYTINSLLIAHNDLTISGADGGLTVRGAVDIGRGAELTFADANALSAGSLVNEGQIMSYDGKLECSGSFLNKGTIWSSNLTLTTGSFDNAGTLISNGVTTINVAPGGYASGPTLTGGSYDVLPNGVLDLNIGNVITTDAADITLGQNSRLQSYNGVLGAYQTIETTLQKVAAGGVLELGAGVADNWGDLAIDGLLVLEHAQPTIAQLTIDPRGVVMGVGSISGPIVDNGTLVAGLRPAYNASPFTGGELDITGPVSGTGTIEFAPAPAAAPGSSYMWTLALDAVVSVNIAFADGRGKLVLNDPSGFTGSIKPAAGDDQVQVSNVAFSSVTGYSYAGDAQSGTLTIDLSGGSHLDLKFIGDLQTADFSLSAAPRVLSSDPQSLLIDVSLPAAQTIPAPDVVRDDFLASGVSGILMENKSGAVVVGQIIGGHETYSTVAALGPEWTFEGVGKFLGDGSSDFLIENTSGQVFAGEVGGDGAVVYMPITNLSPEWSFAGVGDFIRGSSQDQFLIETANGVIQLGNVDGPSVVAFTQSASALPGVKLVVGDFLGHGVAQFLYENSAGELLVGEFGTGADQQTSSPSYTSIGGLGPEWKLVETGDFLGDGRDQLLIENTSGVVALGEVGASGLAQFTKLTALGSEWSFVGAGEYLAGEAHDQFMLRNANGALVVGDYVDGKVSFTQVGAVGSEWSFHG